MTNGSSWGDLRCAAALCAVAWLLGCAGVPTPPPVVVEIAPAKPLQVAEPQPEAPPREVLPSFLESMAGTWQYPDSSARFRIAVADGKAVVDGWNASGGERFRVLEVRVLKHGLFFRVVMPSTKWETSHEVRVVDRDTLHAVRKHGSDATQTTMTRSTDAPPPDAEAAGAGAVP